MEEAWTLFAAFDIQTGEVIAQLHRRKRQVETMALFEAIDKATPRAVKTNHLICDNISIHKGKLARQWLERYPRFTIHVSKSQDLRWAQAIPLDQLHSITAVDHDKNR